MYLKYYKKFILYLTNRPRIYKSGTQLLKKYVLLKNIKILYFLTKRQKSQVTKECRPQSPKKLHRVTSTMKVHGMDNHRDTCHPFVRVAQEFTGDSHP